MLIPLPYFYQQYHDIYQSFLLEYVLVDWVPKTINLFFGTVVDHKILVPIVSKKHSQNNHILYPIYHHFQHLSMDILILYRTNPLD